MPRDKKGDKILDWWISRHKEDFVAEMMMASEAERACETFPADRILDFIDLLNSNFAPYLLIKYGDELIDIISDEIDAGKYKITPEELQKRLKKAKNNKPKKK